MATDLPRTPQARALAEEALIRLVRQVGEHRLEIVVIGGLAPAFLTRQAPIPHQGTTDVDILLSLAVRYDRDEQDFSWLERGLTSAGFTQDPQTGSGWRWTITLHGVPVKVDLLCDVGRDEGNQPLALPGCAVASATNLEGPRAAIADAQVRALTIPDDLGGGQIAVPHANLGGFLITKAAALVRRHLDKDYYDFAFVLLNNDHGGPTAAARAILDGPAAGTLPHFRRDLQDAVRAFTETDRPGAWIYAATMRRSGEASDIDQLAQDASGAAREFATALGLA